MCAFDCLALIFNSYINLPFIINIRNGRDLNIKSAYYSKCKHSAEFNSIQ